MALSASTVIEVRNTADYAGASDINGGGFVTGASGTDYSFASINANGSAKYTLANGGATTASATITTVSASADMVGNIAYISGGTGSITGGWYQIISQVTGTSITLDRSTGIVTGTGVGITIGGCLATPGLAASLLSVSGMIAWVRYSSTAYSLTTATPGSGGPANLVTGVTTIMAGYDQSRGDRTGNRPQVSWASVASPGSPTYIFLAQGAVRQIFANLLANGNSVANVSGFNVSASTKFSAMDCVAENAVTGFLSLSTGNLTRCFASMCTTGFSAGSLWQSQALSCTTGFSAILSANQCLSSLCGTGFTTTVSGAYYRRCTADSSTTIGFDLTPVSGVTADSCLSTNQSGGGGIGFKVVASSVLLSCAVYNNTTHISGTPQLNFGQVTCTQQPYVNPGSDFRPNATAGGGALLRGAGIGVYGQVDNVDIGALQHYETTAWAY